MPYWKGNPKQDCTDVGPDEDKSKVNLVRVLVDSENSFCASSPVGLQALQRTQRI
jgi:hypothetical protein